MSESKMERVLYDYHLAQGMAETIPHEEGKTLEQVRYEYLQAMLRKHGITEAELDSSLAYYCSDLTRLNRIYRNLEERLQREADALGVAAGPRDIYADLSAEGDTANVWRDRALFIVKSRPIDNLQMWEMECDSTWLLGDDVLWRFSLLKVARNFQGDTYADLVVLYTNDSVRSHLISVGSRQDAELRVDNPRDWTPRRICGHFYTAVETKPEDMRYVFALQPSLIRFHKPLSVRERWTKGDSLAADTLSADTLHADSVQRTDSSLSSAEYRRTPEQFREEQVVDKRINVVKEKPYQPTRGNGRRRQIRKPAQRRLMPTR